jgi:hypothetical protein
MAFYLYLASRLGVGPPLGTVGGLRKYDHCIWDSASVGAMEAQYRIGVGNPITGLDPSERCDRDPEQGLCSHPCAARPD